jgi:hypothetical protein
MSKQTVVTEKNLNTDSTSVTQQSTEKHVDLRLRRDMLPSDAQPNVVDLPDNDGDNSNEDGTQEERPHYEVVLFAKYYEEYPRPSEEDLIKFFSNYGTVHHVKCPDDRNIAFIFITKLSTTEEHRRTRVTITQIIRDMTPETKFRVNVANSRPRNNYNNNNNNGGNNYQNGPPRNNNGRYNNNQGYTNNRNYNNDQGYQNQSNNYVDNNYDNRQPQQRNNGNNYDNRQPQQRNNGYNNNYDNRQPQRNNGYNNYDNRQPRNNGGNNNYDNRQRNNNYQQNNNRRYNKSYEMADDTQTQQTSQNQTKNQRQVNNNNQTRTKN